MDIPRPVCLMTDFGTQDPYVGLMKSVIQAESPYPPIIDLTHQVPPQDERSAVFLLEYCYPDLPQHSILLLVVDPMVGTERDIIAVRTGDGSVIVAPDRGLVDGLPVDDVFRVDEPPNERSRISTTFHGRDWFAPTARFLSLGGELSDLGPRLDYQAGDSLVPEAERDGNNIHGEVVYVDRFGNLITNIPEAWLDGTVSVSLGDYTVDDVVETYGDHTGIVALVGSFGRLEIAVPGGSAREQLGLGTGTVITVNRTS